MKPINILFLFTNFALLGIAYLQYKSIDDNLTGVTKHVDDLKEKIDKIL